MMIMPHRERFFTSLEIREPDMVPVTDLGLDPPIVEAITGEKLGGFSQVVVAEENAWQAAVRNRLATSKACIKLGFDAIPAISNYVVCGKRYKPRYITETRFIDQWGRVVDSREDTKTSWYIGGTVKTEEDMKNYVAPDPEEEGRFEMVKKTIGPFKNRDIAIMGMVHSGWHMAFQVRGGIDRLLIDMHRRPALAKSFIEKVGKSCFGTAKLFIEGGVEALFLNDDYADSHGPFMNSKLFKEFELPNVRRIIDFAKKKDVPVLKHSDGNLYPMLEDVIATGINGLHPIEPGAMDLRDVKQRYGNRMSLLGNVDCRFVLPFGTEEVVRRDVRRCIDEAAIGGGFVLTSSNSIHANCKVENVYTMVDEARKYGKYPLRQKTR